MEDILQHTHDILTTNAKRWLALTESISPDLLRRAPAPGEWSAVECLQHLLDTERSIFPARIEHLLAGRDFAAFDPDSEGTKPGANLSPKEMAADYARCRELSLAVLARVTLADLHRTARHSELGIVTMSELLHEWAAHDLMHTVQAERAIMQPFITASGPWRHYFKDHDIQV